MQKYFRTRENRNFSTVKSTESRIFNFSLIEVLMMAGMAGLQVLVVRFFFQGARKGTLRCARLRNLADKNRIRVNALADAKRATRKMRSVRCAHIARHLRSYFPTSPTLSAECLHMY